MNLGMETETLEFKKTTGELKEGIISLTSMLNKHNYGELYFGVKNNGEVCGQMIGDMTLRDISHAIGDYIRPQIIPEISLILIDNMNVIKVKVEGAESPYSAYGKYYMRSSDEDRELLPNQLRSLMQEKYDYDSIINMEANNSDLSFNQLKSLLITKGLSINDETFYNNFSLKTKNNRFNYMAYLLSDNNDISITVSTFKGYDKTELIKRNEYGFKSLAISMDQVLTYVEALNDTSVVLNNHQRKEKKLFDFSCFKEAWQNACIHNKWVKKNPPQVYIFKDRIEIVSTGGLQADMDIEEFYRGISKPINMKLQKIFGQLGYVEQTGHGVPLIISRYGIQAFNISNNFITVTIPFDKEMINNKDLEKKKRLNKSQEKILSFIMSNPYTTIKEMREKLDMSDGNVRKIITQLKEYGFIEHQGSNKNGSWIIL